MGKGKRALLPTLVFAAAFIVSDRIEFVDRAAYRAAVTAYAANPTAANADVLRSEARKNDATKTRAAAAFAATAAAVTFAALAAFGTKRRQA